MHQLGLREDMATTLGCMLQAFRVLFYRLGCFLASLRYDPTLVSKDLVSDEAIKEGVYYVWPRRLQTRLGRDLTHSHVRVV